MTSRSGPPTLLDRLLRPFSRVHPGEGAVAALMLVCVFLILTAYYVMKTAREGLILSGGTWGLRGDELKTYANGAMALLLAGVVPAYGMLANRARRIRLINVSYAIVIACLIAFFVLGTAGVPVGLPFFVWLGLVSVFLIAQFWSYANDLYTEEQGKRLFAIIATGGSLGAIFGPRIAKVADTFTLMLIAGGILLACITLFNVIERVNNRGHHDHRATDPINGAGGFALVLRDRYLLLIACLLLVANLVNTTGEYVLSNAAREHAMQLVPARAGVDDAVIAAERRELIKAFYSDFFYWVNLVSFLIQAFLVSRILDKLGVRRALFVLPLVAFGAYAFIGAVGGLMLVRAAKIAENATDYSLQNTVRQALFLPTDRVAKYKAKAAIDTFFVRFGDTLSAVLVGLGIHQLGFAGRDLAVVNLVLIVVWVAIAAGIARRHRLISRETERSKPASRIRRLLLASLLVASPAFADEPRSDEPTAADVATSPKPGDEGGRTDEPEGDSLLRDIGQGVLVPPRVAVELTMAPVRASVWALDRYKLIDRWKQVFFDDSETYGLYPTAVLDSSYGFTVGARFVHRNVLGHREHLALKASAGGEYRAQADAGVRTGRLLGDHVQLAARGEFERRPSDSFYGIGNSTDAMATHHRQELERGALTVDILAVDALHVLSSGALTDLAYGRSDEGPAIDMVYDPSVLTGWNGARNVYGELELRWDRRGYASALDRHHTFDTGFLLSAYGGRVHQLDAGNDYWRWGGDAQKFFRIGAGPRAISTRLRVEGVTGEYDDVAFTELPQLGGKMLLRGYPRDRFRDRLAALTSVEYTWDLGQYPVASVFVDVGRVFPGFRDLEPTNLRMGYGISLQLHSDRQFLASVSLASSIDGGVFVDLAFDPVFDLEPRVERR